MSFSDKRVADVVNSKFVAAWTNRGPGFRNTEFWTEKGISDRNYEIYPTKNICTFFLTPDRKVFYYAAGSYAPEVFLKILDTASTLRKLLFDEQMQLTPKGSEPAAKFHEETAATYESLMEDAARPEGWKSLVKSIRPGVYRGSKHVHSASCGGSLKEGYEYLSALHREWSARKTLPELDQVRYQYLYGNEFTEETADSSHVSRPETPPPPKPVDRRPKALRVADSGTKDATGLDLTGIRLYP